MKQISLFLLLSIANANAHDTTITYQGGRQFGTFKINGRSIFRPDTSSITAPDTVRFSTGLTLITAGMPSCLLSCSIKHFTGILIQPGTGASGYKSASDTLWDFALQFPTALVKLDTMTTLQMCNNPYVGKDGLVVSYDSSLGCQGTNFFPEQGYNRIFYYRSGNDFMKLQVTGFELDTILCYPTSPEMCPTSKNAIFKYYISNDGNFPIEPTSIRSFQGKKRVIQRSSWKAWFQDFFDLVRGRKPK